MTDIFQQSYYRVNKFLMCFVGQWPYQSRAKRFLLLAFIASIESLQLISQILAVVRFWDVDVIIESTPPFIVCLNFIFQITNVTFNSEKLLNMFQRIKIDWMFMAQQPEMHMLREYAEKGKQFTIVYAVGLCLTTILYMSQPFLPGFQKFNNETTSKSLPLPVDYFGLDVDVYYYYMLAYLFFVNTYGVLIIVVMETTFLLLVQHACGMFTVVGHQLQRLADDITDEFAERNSQPKLDTTYRHFILCIKKHNDVIEFSKILEASYTWVFLLILGVTVVVIGVSGVQTLLMIDKNPKGAVRFVAFPMVLIGHQFLISLLSQKLIDHSQRISESLYQAQWYRTSLETQKLLNLVTIRAHVPCRLTAGKIVTISMGNFTSVLRTSMSYFTVIRSMQ